MCPLKATSCAAGLLSGRLGDAASSACSPCTCASWVHKEIGCLGLAGFKYSVESLSMVILLLEDEFDSDQTGAWLAPFCLLNGKSADRT